MIKTNNAMQFNAMNERMNCYEAQPADDDGGGDEQSRIRRI